MIFKNSIEAFSHFFFFLSHIVCLACFVMRNEDKLIAFEKGAEFSQAF